MKDEQPTPAQPAAYDSEGRPLYYQEPPQPQPTAEPASLVGSKPETLEGHNFNPQLRTQYANEPKLVHAKREVEPQVSVVSDELKEKHEKSVRQYPFLNLSEGEYVVLRISRHPIGLLIPLFFTVLSVIIFTTLILLVPDLYANMRPAATGSTGLFLPQEITILVLFFMIVMSVLLGGATIWIYQKNQFFMTNESVIQEIQHSLFSHHEQTVSLGSIEDASYKRQGILQHLFNYGTLRLSTEGEETTYRFSYVENPKEQVAIVSNAVEAFKNGRPVLDD